MDSIKGGPIRIDDHTVLILIEVGRSQIVFLHAIMEGYDGFAVVKTIDEAKGIVGLITTPHYLDSCINLLDSLREEIPWRYFVGAAPVSDIFQYVER